jgi:hypothetical protein
MTNTGLVVNTDREPVASNGLVVPVPLGDEFVRLFQRQWADMKCHSSNGSSDGGVTVVTVPVCVYLRTHWLRLARKDLRRETKIMFHFVSLDRGRAEVGMIFPLRNFPQREDQQERRTMEFNALLSEVMDYVFQYMMMLSSLASSGGQIPSGQAWQVSGY